MRTILIVDDNRDSLIVLEQSLEKIGYFVIAYDSPREALHEVENGLLYDVALLDRAFEHGMMDGDMLAVELKRLYPRKPIIMQSGYPQEHRVGGYAFQDAYLLKPYGIETLDALIRRLCG